jgi:uncharacterized protein
MSVKVKMGTLQRSFNGGMYQDITLSVTEECNLRCKYCYMIHKNHFNRMSFETAKAAVDEILQRPVKFDSAVWNFIGGEPTLEMDLIDRITDYIKIRTFELNHPWFGNSAFFIGSNGLLYESEPVQNYLAKNKGIASVGITIDGNKEKHDLQRVYPNGKGSYDDVVRNVKLWIKQNPGPKTTKATYANDDLKYLKDSVISLWELGIDYVSANVVFENVWDENAPVIFENQLHELADYIIENELWDKYSVRFFDPHVGFQIDEANKSRPHCGSGKMIAVSSAGKYYPCIRFLDFCMGNTEEGYCIGEVGCGINDTLLEPFSKLSIGLAFTEKCKTCKVAQGCPSCTGFNYDDSKGLSIFQKTMYHCEMHKAQVRASKYFWRRYSQETGLPSPFQINRINRFIENGWDIDNLDFVYVLESDRCIPYCDYKPRGTQRMPQELLEQIIISVDNDDAFPIVVTDNPHQLPDILKGMAHAIIYPAICNYKKTSELEFCIPVFEVSDVHDVDLLNVPGDICILNVTPNNIAYLSNAVTKLVKVFKRVNINKIELLKWDNDAQETYKKELIQCKKEISATEGHLDVMRPRGNRYCEAGYSSYAICPDGYIYPCPAFYFSDVPTSIGTYKGGVESRFREIFRPGRVGCTGQEDCAYLNRKVSKVISVPAEIMRKISAIEASIFGK